MTEPARALSATPVSNSPAMEPGVSQRAARSSRKTTSKAPVKAAAGSSQNLRWAGSAKPMPAKNTMASAANMAAPVVTPSRPGSARGLRNRPCVRAPDSPSAAPTSAANRARGRRISHST